MPKLVMLSDGVIVREVRLGLRDLTIGRAQDNDVVLDDPDKTVSRYHAEVRLEGNDYVLVDVGSQNGVWVGQKQVSEVDLRPGMTLSVGSFQIRFDRAPGDPDFASADWADSPEPQLRPGDSSIATADTRPPMQMSGAPGLGPPPRREEPPTSRPEAEARTGRPPIGREAAAFRPGWLGGSLRWPHLAIFAGIVGVLVLAVVLWPRPPVPPPPDKELQQHLLDARAALDRGLLQEAQDAVAKALTVSADNVEALELETRIQNALKSATTNEEAQRQARTSELQRHLLDARAALDSGLLQDAQAAVRRALTISSDNVEALELETRVQNAIKSAEARGDVLIPETPQKEAPAPWPMLTRRPNETPAALRERSRVMFERYGAAEGLLRGKRFAEAAAAFTAIQAEQPGYQSVADRLNEARAGITALTAEARKIIAAGSALEASGDLVGAMSEYERARQLAPSLNELDSLVKQLRGRMVQKGHDLFVEASQYHSHNKFKEAADLYQRVLTLLPPDDPKHVTAKTRLEVIRAGRGRKPDAGE